MPDVCNTASKFPHTYGSSLSGGGVACDIGRGAVLKFYEVLTSIFCSKSAQTELNKLYLVSSLNNMQHKILLSDSLLRFVSINF